MKPSIIDDEHLEFIIESCDKHKDLVRARFASRHSNSKNYLATIQYNNKDDDEPIQGWFCTCTAGARIVGCCAHITALILYLGASQAEPESTQHRLSAIKYLQYTQDVIQYSDIDSTDEESCSSAASSTGDD